MDAHSHGERLDCDLAHALDLWICRVGGGAKQGDGVRVFAVVVVVAAERTHKTNEYIYIYNRNDFALAYANRKKVFKMKRT